MGGQDLGSKNGKSGQKKGVFGQKNGGTCAGRQIRTKKGCFQTSFLGNLKYGPDNCRARPETLQHESENQLADPVRLQHESDNRFSNLSGFVLDRDDQDKKGVFSDKKRGVFGQVFEVLFFFVRVRVAATQICQSIFRSVLQQYNTGCCLPRTAYRQIILCCLPPTTSNLH